MRTLAIIIAPLILGIVSCSTERESVSTRDFRDPSLEPFVGQRVTLQGKLRSPGKFGPFLLVDQTAIYFKPIGREEIYRYSKIYDDLNGYAVEVTGTLHFEQYQRIHQPPAIAAPVNHYWFEDETAQIQAKPVRHEDVGQPPQAAGPAIVASPD